MIKVELFCLVSGRSRIRKRGLRRSTLPTSEVRIANGCWWFIGFKSNDFHSMVILHSFVNYQTKHKMQLNQVKAYLPAEEDSALGGGASPGTTTLANNNLALAQTTPVEDAAAVVSGGGAMQGE